MKGTIISQRRGNRLFPLFCLTIFLIISGCTKDEGASIDPDFLVDFEISLSNDLAPAEVTITNTSEKATTFNWDFQGGAPNSSTSENPGSVTYSSHGEFTITLEASNGPETKTVSKTFKLYETDEIVTFENVTLGSTHLESTIGVSFSTSTGNVIASGNYNSSNGPKIDIVYFGSEEHSLFTMISPTTAGTIDLTPIPGATETIRIYETSSSSEFFFTADEFDQMTDDRSIRELSVVDNVGSLTPGVTGETDLPRVFIFKNFAGKKGLIKVTELTKGTNGNIVFDIKIQK